MLRQADLKAAAKRKALESINKLRVEKNLNAVHLSENLSATADVHSDDMSSQKFLSHFGLGGEAPYQRYFLGGSTSHVIERIWGLDAPSDDSFDESSEQALLDLVVRAKDALGLEEPSPALDQHATHVGIGISLTDTTFRYVEVYSSQVAELAAVPESELRGSDLVLAGRVSDPSSGVGPAGAIVYRTPMNIPLGSDAETAFPVDAFEGPYVDYGDDIAASVFPWELKYDAATGEFECNISFREVPTEGVYYVQMFFMQQGDGDGIPYGGHVEGLTLPLPGSFPAVAVALTVGGNVPADDATPDAQQFRPKLGARPGRHKDESADSKEAGIASERSARAYARAQSTEIDPQPLRSISAMAGVGLLVPESGLEQRLFLPVERSEGPTGGLPNISFCFQRFEAGEDPSDDDVGAILDVAFCEVPLGADVADCVPPGFEVVGGELGAMMPEETNPADGGDDRPPAAYLCVRRGVASGPGERYVVDCVVVYGDRGFDVGSGFETMQLPEAIIARCDCPLYLAIKREGAGREAADLEAERAGREAEGADEDAVEAAQHSAGGSRGGGGTEEDEFEDETVNVGRMGREELERREREKMEERQADLEEEEDEEAERMEQNRLNELQDEVASLEAERTQLTRDHAELQRKLSAFFAGQKRRDNADRASDKEAVPAHETEKQYNDTLTSIVLSEDKLNSQKSEYDKIAIDLQTRLDEKEYKANEISQSFRDFKREIARSSENSRTGRPMSKAMIEQFEKDELKKDEEAERVRLKNINLRMTLKKLENQLRAKEQLAEGLHLIDFEQLKIENQTLNEKIEERNEELHKLRKKNTTTVQVLTHVKEKLQAVAADNDVAKGQLADLDHQLTAARDRLAKLKRARDALRAENLLQKQKQGFANSDLLIVDYENRQHAIIAIKAQLEELMERHEILMAQTGQHSRK